jgi:predicted transcriptional regulator
MEILSMLWDAGAMTLRQAHERFGEFGRPIAYPTMQTRLNRMVEKGLLRRSAEFPAEYNASVTRDQVSLGHLRQILDKVSQGDVVPLVARLLTEQTLSAEQIAELKVLLVEAQQKSKAASNPRRPS